MIHCTYLMVFILAVHFFIVDKDQTKYTV